MTDVNMQDLRTLLVHFSKNTYRARDADSTNQEIMQKCVLLANLDYTHYVINNNGGELCAHYPSQLIILEYEKYRNFNVCDTPPPLSRTAETIYESMYDPNKLKELIKNARFARCRARFPLPVIMYKGRHVCRSSTLSAGAEIFGRCGVDYLLGSSEETTSVQQQQQQQQQPLDEAQGGVEPGFRDWQLFDKVRRHDIKLLKSLNIGTIIDFMVEKKKVKYGVHVTSSEKVDKERRYSDFILISLPYPGCEFFKEFRESNYVANQLRYDWSQSHIDAHIEVPEDAIATQLKIGWEEYRRWDLVKLTQNYLKLILKYLADSSSGILVHCISGWDRTPLFISLLRLSLWADGAIHTSLNAHQILYYTIAYDWMLFGHDLEDRISKGEEIFFFCFYFLKHMGEEEYSIHHRQHTSRSSRHSVLRNDSDSQLDNVMFDNEFSSSLSLNSWSSSHSQNSRDSQDNNPPAVFSTDSQDDIHGNGNTMTPWPFCSPNKEGISHGSRSPLPQNRTSPVAVPVPCRLRQRNESSSSGGSWQMISGTGSLRGSTTANAPLTDGLSASRSPYESCTGSTSQESSATIIEDDASASVPSTRKEKVQSVRSLFYTAYSHTIGFRMKDPEPSGIGQLIGNFAEKVGILPAQRTSL